MRALEPRRLESLLGGFSRVRLLVVGDLVLDEYVWGEVDRVSPEAPVPVVHVREETVVLGGAANVVRNAVALGASVAFCSVLGDDAAGRRTLELLEELGVEVGGLILAPGRPTTRKTRIIARSQQVVRFDRETLEPPPPSIGRKLLEAIENALPAVDGVVIEDYGKGMLSNRIAAAAMRRFHAAGTPVVVDPKTTVVPYRGAALLKPNLRETETLSGVPIRGPDDLTRAVAGPGVDVPTVAREVFDVQGAGDTTIAALALALRAGAELLEAAVIANAVAGVVVGKVGTATASVDEVRELLPAAISAARGPS
jgi:D-beta-D-heptose 7-phosphate kinase/D-beta-D-heptose 1-phosphate adenosyltransferase